MLLKSSVPISYIMVVCLIFLAMGQCKDFEDCRSLYTSRVEIKFISKDTNNKKPLYFDFIAVDDHAIALNNVADKEEEEKFAAHASVLSIFLNPVANSTTIYLTRSGFSLGQDTITIFYQRYPSMLSPLCGTQQEYVLDSVHTTFSGASIIHKVLKVETAIGSDQGDVQIFY
jgi:hypothetical protein